MNEPTPEQAKNAVLTFLEAQFQKKAEPHLKKLERLDPIQDAEQSSQLNAEITALKNKYTLDNWMEKDAMRMVGQLRFGTHLSKGVHPDSRGDNIYFAAKRELPPGVVGSQSLDRNYIDANGNAAALPLAALFDQPIDAESTLKLRDLIVQDSDALKGAFSDNPELSSHYQQQFKQALTGQIEQPRSFELNKQILWPQADAIEQDAYTVLIPLFPAALSHRFYEKLNELRFGEATKQARDNRKKANAEQQTYPTLPDIAAIKLGGTKPQNISQLTSKRGGRSFLLPSLPPRLPDNNGYRLYPKQVSLFEPRLAQNCSMGLQQLYSVAQNPLNNFKIREQRKQALDTILEELFALADYLQTSQPAGWSKNSALNTAHKYWLDPHRAQIDSEIDFAVARETSDWQQEIIDSFALWLNQRLHQRFPKLAAEIGDDEYREWQGEIKDAISLSLRQGKETFA